MEEIVEKYREELMGYAGIAEEARERRGLSEDEYGNGKASLHV